MIASWGRLAIAYIRPKYIVYALMMSVFIAVVYEIPLDFAVIIVFGIMLAVVVLVHLMIEKLLETSGWKLNYSQLVIPISET